jgi:3-oxoacyl-[acyl-carrier protein] reductase
MTEDLAMMKSASAEALGPQFVAPVALFLASEASAGITGQIVGVEGGHLFRWHMGQTEGVQREQPWSADEIREQWGKIVG